MTHTSMNHTLTAFSNRGFLVEPSSCPAPASSERAEIGETAVLLLEGVRDEAVRIEAGARERI